MPASIWKGYISFGLVNIPVSLHGAETGSGLSFTMIDKENISPVGYKTYNKKTGEDIPRSQIVKGYEYDKEKYVFLNDEDFRKANVKATETIEIVQFVKIEDVNVMHFEKPYYLAPAGKGMKAYAILRAAIRESGKIGIANIVMHGRQHLAGVTVSGSALVLEILRFSHEIKSPKHLDLPGEDLKKLGIKDKEVGLAVELVNDLSEKLDLSQFHDTYHEDLLKLIQAKVKKHQTTRMEDYHPPKVGSSESNVVDFMSLLERSMKHSKKKARGSVSHARRH